MGRGSMRVSLTENKFSISLVLLAGCVCSQLHDRLPGDVCGNGVDDDRVDQINLIFVCGAGTSIVCGSHPGNQRLCCQNRGDGCCQQGGCSSTGTCCKCPRNGLNACVQPSFGCGGC